MTAHEKSAYFPDGLPEQFTQPKNWNWQTFERVQGRKIRIGSVVPDHNQPDAAIICLPGLSEFGEKYFETARWALSKNFTFHVIDWAGQGLSSRYLDDKHKRHISSYQDDIDDLNEWIENHIKPTAVSGNGKKLPLIFLGHSMGGHIGLRYLQQHQNTISCAAFSAPMLGSLAINVVPEPLRSGVTSIANLITGRRYASKTRGWSPLPEANAPCSVLTSDDIRVKIQNHYSVQNEALKIGGVTWRWVDQTVKSCRKLNAEGALESIMTPVFLAKAGQDALVSNIGIDKASNLIRHTELLDLPSAKHEILMEKNEIRDLFLDQFHKNIEMHVIDKPETLQPS